MLHQSRRKKGIDKSLFYLTCTLVLVGLIAVADASAPQALSVFGDRFYFVKQQVLWALMGLVGMIITSKINYRFWEKAAIPIFLGSIVLLIVVLIPGVGSKVMGARRWLFIGPVSIQPSEVAKFALCLYFARLASKNKKIIPFLVWLALMCLLIMLQPDLGTTLILASIGFIQIFLAGVNLIYYFGSAFVALAVSYLVIIVSDYRKQRLLTFLKQTGDPLGTSYHIRQILFSLGLGGFFGVGLGASRQKFLFLPEAATDSIFAVIAEEVGFFGATILIILLFYFVIKAFKLAMRAPDRFSQVLAAGIGAWIGSQILLNIGSTVALVPLTGVPLPFFSYGGSSIFTILISLGILLNISGFSEEMGKKKGWKSRN